MTQPSKTSISLIITVLNEEKTIKLLLDAIKKQNLLPSEIIIVDGGSTDRTLKIIQKFAQKNPKLKIKSFVKKGNRSVGRNFAIQEAKNQLIAITDAGCIPQRDWLEQLYKKWLEANSSDDKKQQTKVVAGYYQGQADTAFQEAVIPYVLVMPERVNEKNFLPATRSMLIEKSIWQQVNGFDKKLNYNEDYAFAKKLKKQGFRIVFAKKAVVDWLPRTNLKAFMKMIYLFARGDIEAGILRPKVILIFARYFLMVFILVLLEWKISGQTALLVALTALIIYSAWAIVKNLKYTPKGWFYLPLLQISSDLAVILGSLRGFFIYYFLK
ncbi:MAG: glycosyltransferase [Candidatus Woesebacteria bacterium]|jgi:glycosyltransferase involved in cell wall biosynthesis